MPPIRKKTQETIGPNASASHIQNMLICLTHVKSSRKQNEVKSYVFDIGCDIRGFVKFDYVSYGQRFRLSKKKKIIYISIYYIFTIKIQ